MGRNDKEVIRLKRIAWVTPLNNDSAIGRHSIDVCNELANIYNIDIIYPDCDNVINNNFLNIKISDINNIDILDRYDYIIYNLGNNYKYHKDIYELLCIKKGIVVLHDQTMYDFFYEYFYVNNDASIFINKYINFIKKYYSDEETRLFADTLKQNLKMVYNENSINVFNVLNPVLINAKGVFTHSKSVINKLREIYTKPVMYSYLTCERSIKNNDKIYNFIPNDDRMLIVSTGYINRNKRIDKVLNVLINNRVLAKKVKYVVIGDNSDVCAKEMIELSKNELKDTLYMLGYQTQEIMESAIYNADLCINLRYPNSEVCSLSVLEQMINGKPVCVTNKGFFKELPDDSVIKISVENEIGEIEKVLNNIISNKNYYKKIENNAVKFVQENCKITTYTDKFIKFLNECDEFNYIEDDYINKFIEKISEKYNKLGITKDNGNKYINIAIERIYSMVKN